MVDTRTYGLFSGGLGSRMGLLPKRLRGEGEGFVLDIAA
jgi:hypothetical protein